MQFNVPGGFKGIILKSIILSSKFNFLIYLDPNGRITTTRARFIAWINKYNCSGYYRHNLCVFGIGDVPFIIKRLEIFANKLLIEYDPFAFMCLDEWLTTKINLLVSFDKYFYCRSPNVLAYTEEEKCFPHIKKKSV